MTDGTRNAKNIKQENHEGPGKMEENTEKKPEQKQIQDNKPEHMAGTDYKEDNKLTDKHGEHKAKHDEHHKDSHNKAKEKIKEILNLLEEKDKKLKEANDKFLRLYADFDNYKKRNESEKKLLCKTANERVFKDLLTLIDQFDFALNMMNGQEETEFTKGIKLIYKQMEDFLCRNEITRIEALGQKFDPNFHTAMAQEQAKEGQQPGTVLKEYQKGYMFCGKVLRPTVAIVSQ